MPQFNIQFHHDLSRLAPGVRKGRVPLDGYMRGCGMQFGNVIDLCKNDPDFVRAFAMAQGRTIVSPHNLANLFMLVAFYLPKLPNGHIVEFGSYKGGSAMFMAHLAQRFLPGVQVYAFDTFGGMPSTDAAIDVHKAGDFADASADTIRADAAALGLTNLHLVPGRFEDTAVATLKTIGHVSLAHIDCDIYCAVQCAYDAVKPHMVPGGYIALDDPLTASCLGAFEAMEELFIQRDGLHAEQSYPHMVFRYPPLKDESGG